MRKRKRPSGTNPKTPTLDLHGFRVEEVEETLLQFLSDQILKGTRVVHIVHGHGKGKVKEAVKRILGNSDVVKSFKAHEMNSGAVIVYL